MKQRSRLMNGGDDLITHMDNSKKDDPSDILLNRMRTPEHYIEAQVQEGDTLQAIALRFYCSISELKRINHIHKDNEIFARRTIKVPVTPYSVLTEQLPQTQTLEPVPSTSSQVPGTHTSQGVVFSGNRNGQLLYSTSAKDNTNVNNNEHTIDCNAVVMNSTLAPSVVPFRDAEETDVVSEDTQLLPNKQRESVEAVVVKELTSHGADWGLKWFHLVCFLIILGVVIPIVYVMFYLQVPNHPHVESNSTR